MGRQMVHFLNTKTSGKSLKKKFKEKMKIKDRYKQFMERTNTSFLNVLIFFI